MSIGILLVTGGRTHQEGYGAAFQADPRARLIAVSDEPGVDERRAALNQRLADELRIPYIRDLGEALRRDGIQAASICTEHHRQGRLSIRCAEAGKHLYVDKPLAGSLDEARRLERIVREKKLLTQMFTQVTAAPARKARRLLERGQVGDLRAIHHDLLFAKGFSAGLPLVPRKETAAPAPDQFLVPEAKREMFNIAVYSLALFRWITGRKAFRSVAAHTANYFFDTNKKHGMEDFGAMLVGLDGGITATVAAGRTGWRSHPGSGHHRIRLFGSRGSAIVDAFAGHAEITSDQQSNWRVPPKNPDDPMGFWSSSDQRKTGGPEWWLPAPPAKSDQSHFLDCLEKNREPEVTVPDGVRILEVLFAAYRSAAEKRTVALG
ncbi:MAG: Gfo/Idh/MocA family oxidoreductase [Acidobacteria bacterium]|nr:Gfo/Idh/MocA family oxidoreductase [Acidobacteriota bacterium]